MAFLAALLIAAPAASPAPEGLMPGADGFDLARAGKGRSCRDSEADEIVVCARRKSDEIVVAHPEAYQAKPARAEVKLPSGATVDVHAEQHVMPDGRSAPAAMVRVRIPF